MLDLTLPHDSLKGDRQVIAKLEEAEKLLKTLKKALSR